jgi:hypothetical protein
VDSLSGEALVTNSAPGIESELLPFSLFNAPTEYHSRSTFSPGQPLTTYAELANLRCNLQAIHQHFRPLLDPNRENPWFAMDIEWKLMGPDRAFVIKQARAYSFGDETREGWCDS